MNKSEIRNIIREEIEEILSEGYYNRVYKNLKKDVEKLGWDGYFRTLSKAMIEYSDFVEKQTANVNVAIDIRRAAVQVGKIQV